jgi:peptidoglycan hydrolase-like protein with peptidoglycan-binding domain
MDHSYLCDKAEWARWMLIARGGAMYPCFPDRIIGRREGEGKAMRALILALSILAIIDSAHFAKAGPSSTPRETLAPADTAIATNEATQATEEQIGLTKAKRRNVQRRLTRLGFDTKVNGTFDESTRAVIARWQEEYGYPATGFLNAAQHKVLTDAAKEAGKSDRKDRRRAGGHARSRGVSGPIGAIGGAVHGVVGGVGSAVGGLFRR